MNRKQKKKLAKAGAIAGGALLLGGPALLVAGKLIGLAAAGYGGYRGPEWFRKVKEGWDEAKEKTRKGD